jgi:hypothetical protein
VLSVGSMKQCPTDGLCHSQNINVSRASQAAQLSTAACIPCGHRWENRNVSCGRF